MIKECRSAPFQTTGLIDQNHKAKASQSTSLMNRLKSSLPVPAKEYVTNYMAFYYTTIVGGHLPLGCN